ncbi:hypothetical protein SprV_0301278100 [Sparganum proliferum]
MLTGEPHRSRSCCPASPPSLLPPAVLASSSSSSSGGARPRPQNFNAPSHWLQHTHPVVDVLPAPSEEDAPLAPSFQPVACHGFYSASFPPLSYPPSSSSPPRPPPQVPSARRAICQCARVCAVLSSMRPLPLPLLSSRLPQRPVAIAADIGEG